MPVAATRVGGVPEVVEHGKQALLVEPGDVHAMALAMEKLLDPELRRRMSEAALLRAQDFSVEKVARMYSQLYRSLVASG